ncbi:MAG: hypothetical protein JXA46_10505 [Dehalococcoidales bacterium]|nr:hypothetical protein [Dehalococcoidales bacterium]
MKTRLTAALLGILVLILSYPLPARAAAPLLSINLVSPVDLGLITGPVDTTLTIKNAGGGSAVAWTITSNAAWLRADRNSGSASSLKAATVKITADPTGLTPGAHSGAITINSDGGNKTLIFTMEAGVPSGKPDLVITDITWSPANPLVGDKVTFYYTEKNLGNTATGNYVVCLFIGGVSLGIMEKDSLEAGQARSNEKFSYQWTPVIAGEQNVTAQIDISSLVNESNEYNNDLRRTIRVAARMSPDITAMVDLKPGMVTLDKTNVKPGESVTVSFDIQNLGTTASGIFTTGVYFTTYQHLDETLLTTVSSGLIPAGSSKSVSQTVTIPSNITIGGYYLLQVWVDNSRTAIETNEENNKSATGITVTVDTQKPDLQLTDASILLSKDSLPPDGYLMVSATVRNQGTQIAGSFYAVISISEKKGIPGVFLGTLSFGDTAVGSSSTAMQGITLPLDIIVEHDYWIVVSVDPENNVTENNEGNNIASVIIHVCKPKIDLELDEVMINNVVCENMVNCISGTDMDIKLKVNNLGPDPSGSFTIQIRMFYQENMHHEPPLMFNAIYEIVTCDSIYGGGTTSVNKTINIPYYLGALGDFNEDLSESEKLYGDKNGYSYWISIDIRLDSEAEEIGEGRNNSLLLVVVKRGTPPSLPDIELRDITLSKQNVYFGEEIIVTAEIANLGNSPSGPFPTLITMTFFDNQQFFIGPKDIITTESIPGGKSIFVSQKYTCWALVLDEDHSGVFDQGILVWANIRSHLTQDTYITEQDYQNNKKIIPIRISATGEPPGSGPDLHPLILSLNHPQHGISPGDKVTLDIKVQNLGNSSSGPFTTQVRLGSTTLSSIAVQSIAPNTEISLISKVTIPNDLTTGYWYLGVLADSGNNVIEPYEDNNIATWYDPIHIEYITDIQVGPVRLGKRDIKPGDTIPVLFDIQNIGPNTSNHCFSHIYLSETENMPDLSLHKDMIFTPCLPGGSSKTYSMTVTIPSNIAGGKNWIVVCADYLNQNDESNEENNIRSVPIDLSGPNIATPVRPLGGVYPWITTVTPQVFLSISPEVTEQVIGDTFKVTVTAGSDSVDVNACDLVLSFDASAFEVVSITPGKSFGDNPLELEKSLDNSRGIARLATARSGGISGLEGTDSLALVEFKVKPGAIPGKAYLVSIIDIGLANEKGQEIEVGQKNGAVIQIQKNGSSISGGKIISEGSPAGGQRTTFENTDYQKVGDLNSDGKVDYRDLGMFGRAYGTSRGDSNFNEAADMNSDGVVDYRDLAILGGRYGS